LIGERQEACTALQELEQRALVDPDVTFAFELGSGNGFTSQQCIPNQLGIGLRVDHGLQEFSVRRLNRQGVVNESFIR